MLPNTPAVEIEPPDVLQPIIAGRPAKLVWHNVAGGLTYRLDDGAEYVKWTPAASGIDFAAEAARLAWAAGFATVPQVLGQATDADGSWLHTAGIPGENAVSDRWRAEPATAVRAIGQGLRALHDSLPVAGCPFSWSGPDRVADAHRRRTELDPAQWHRDHQLLTVSEALARVDDEPTLDRLVVCHGDACAPNTLIGSDGSWSGHVDFGALGLADRWADLAVATWSTEWNYGPGWERPLLDAYGIDPDPERTAYYRLLWDLGP